MVFFCGVHCFFATIGLKGDGCMSLFLIDKKWFRLNFLR